MKHSPTHITVLTDHQFGHLQMYVLGTLALSLEHQLLLLDLLFIEEADVNQNQHDQFIFLHCATALYIIKIKIQLEMERDNDSLVS